MKSIVFLFGEAERGEFGVPLACRSLPQLLQTLGNPPDESLGIPYAIQALLYQREIVYCRVREEGFSLKDYNKGLALMKSQRLDCSVQALFIPGVGNSEIIETAQEVCDIYNSFLVLTEKDLYDYLTCLGN